jgi:hypothetical protein
MATTPSRLNGYVLGKVLDSTSRVVVCAAERRGPHGFEKAVTAMRLRSELARAEGESAREFAVAARHFAGLCHDQVLPVDDLCVDEQHGIYAIAPPLRGRSLSGLFEDRERAEPLPGRVALQVVLRVADAAHAVITRAGPPLGGLNAESVWVGHAGRLLLLPSVIQRAAFQGRAPLPRHLPLDALGAGGRMSERADVYALGLLLWDLLVLGRESSSNGNHGPTRAAPLPFDAGIVALVMRALSSDPRERQDGVLEFGRDVARLLAREPHLASAQSPERAESAAAAPPSWPQADGTVEIDAAELLPVLAPAATLSLLSVMPSPTRSAFDPAPLRLSPRSFGNMADRAHEDLHGTPPMCARPSPPPPSQPRLRFETGPTLPGASLAGLAGQVALEGDSERWIIGRAGTADVVVPDPDVSRRHFEIVRERSGTYRIHDLGSKNGLFVNGAPVEDGPLCAGDQVRAGGTVLRFDT